MYNDTICWRECANSLGEKKQSPACDWPLEEIHQAIIRLMDAEVVLVGLVSIRGTVFLPPSEPLDNLWTLDLCNLEVSVF